MDNTNAKHIAKLISAHKYWQKVIKKLDRDGSAIIKIGNTGAELVIDKNTIDELRVRREASQVAYELSLYTIEKKAPAQEENSANV